MVVDSKGFLYVQFFTLHLYHVVTLFLLCQKVNGKALVFKAAPLRKLEMT